MVIEIKDDVKTVLLVAEKISYVYRARIRNESNTRYELRIYVDGKEFSFNYKEYDEMIKKYDFLRDRLQERYLNEIHKNKR